MLDPNRVSQDHERRPRVVLTVNRDPRVPAVGRTSHGGGIRGNARERTKVYINRRALCCQAYPVVVPEVRDAVGDDWSVELNPPVEGDELVTISDSWVTELNP